MTWSASGPIFEFVRRVAPDPRLRTAPDQELLRHFLAGDGAAFEALLRRHALMVLDVCRGVLGNEADAEDAFQATFLVLARKAGSVRRAATLASWLHGVAYRTALKARADAARRRKHEARVPGREVPDPDRLTWPEVRAVLHEELGRLSERHRGPLILCYLEGKPQDEAAALCGLSKATLKRRLERGRALLRARLVRRGLGPGALLLAAAWPAAQAPAAPAAVAAAVRAAAAFAAGGATSGVVSPRALTLAKGVVKAMAHTRLKVLAAALLVAALLGGGAALAVLPAPADPQRASPGAGRPAAPGGGAKALPLSKPVVVREDAVVHRLAWARDGKTLATVAVTYDTVALERGKNDEGQVEVKAGTLLPNSTLKLRDAATGALKRSLGEEKHTYFTGLAFSPDGKTAAVAVMRHPHDPPTGGDLSKSEVRLFDVATWAPRDKADVAGPAYALAFSPDGTRLAAGNARRFGKGREGFSVRIWDVRKGKLARSAGEAKPATAGEEKEIAALLADLGDDDADVREKAAKELAEFGRAAEKAVRQALARAPSPALRARLGKVLTLLRRGDLPVNGLAFSPDGKLLACGCFGDDDGKVCLFDGRTGKAVRVLDGHAKCVSGVAFSPDGKTLVSGSFDRTVKLWDAGSGKLRRLLEHGGPVTALAFSRDGRRLATAVSQNWPRRGGVKVFLWDTRTWQTTRVFPDQADDVDALAFSPGGSALALGGGDGRSRDDWPAEGRCTTPGELRLCRVK
jgi:RNA polymerase sigma factor (sigma-70 family)